MEKAGAAVKAGCGGVCGRYPGGMAETDDRERRLAEALRANLRRRKAQARGEAPDPVAPPVGDPPLKAGR
ncbi:hypothetical protein [Sphingomonas solaris]|uniref:Uncharacterized protein n=1 Tax=Alterirhizorhabdus solaris TaxID=2529389 RepID=A0A558RB36_9SPHN|nr:hypothetical protein [Sphingomonas solaris]TVV76574.1 hypothetical protein FOY91_04095 [Sphingomonas solaris]